MAQTNTGVHRARLPNSGPDSHSVIFRSNFFQPARNPVVNQLGPSCRVALRALRIQIQCWHPVDQKRPLSS